MVPETLIHSGPTRIDYLTIRYKFPHQPPELRQLDTAWGTYDIDRGVVRHHLMTVGHFRFANGGLHLVLPGEFWTPRPNRATTLVPERWAQHTYAQAQAAAEHMDRHIHTLHVETTSVPRVDYCVIVPAIQDDHLANCDQTWRIARAIAEVAPAICPHRYGYDFRVHQDPHSLTVEVVQVGTDIEKARQKPVLWRVYYRPKLWGACIRVECEMKQLDGTTPGEQLRLALGLYEAWLALAGLLGPDTRPAELVLAEAPTSKPAGALDAWLRGAGQLLAWSLRAGYDLEPFQEPIEHLAALMRVDLSTARHQVGRYLDRQTKRMESGQAVTLTEPGHAVTAESEEA